MIEAYDMKLLARTKSHELLKRNSLIPKSSSKEHTLIKNKKNVHLNKELNTSRTTSLSPQQVYNRRKNFFEMIGLKHIKDKRPDGQIAELKTNSRRISIIDFMGKNKMNFLKRTGFLEYYEEYERGKGFQKLLEQKQTVSMPNIFHLDKIREYAIRSPASPRDQNLELLFQKQKFGKSDQKARIDIIDNILIKCDDLYSKSNQSKQSFSKILQCSKKNTLKKRLKISINDINSIKKQLA